MKLENTETFLRFSGAVIVAIGFMRISITENFNQGKNILWIGIVVQLIALAFYVYNKKIKNNF